LPQKENKELNLILKNLSDNLRQVVNFGTHILKWDIEKKRNGRDKNVPSVFLRNSIELGDAISLLIEKSSIDPAKILVRSLMESTFSLMYMIEKNEESRSHSFLICRLNKEIKYYKQFIKEEEISKGFVAKFIKQEPHFELENHCNPTEIMKVIKAKKSLLLEENYKEANIEFQRTCNKNKKRNNNPNWYSLYDGPNNFENLCLYLNSTILYEFQYRKYSENVHPNNVMSGFAIAGIDKADILQIRNFKECKEVFYNGVNLLIDVYREFIKMRLPEKQKDFDNWYLNYIPDFEKTDLETKFNYVE
jgi:hypothetical protein